MGSENVIKSIRLDRKLDGFIDENGRLYIKRGSRYKVQRCMYDVDEPCCDLCPNFSEPGCNSGDGLFYINTCRTGLLFSKFEDRRS